MTAVSRPHPERARKEREMSCYDRITYCDVVECCETCPGYGDDCDGYLEEGEDDE